MPTPPIDPLVVQIIRQQKADLLAAERGNMADLTGSWLSMESRLTPAMDSLSLEVAALRAEGKLVTLESLLDSPRYRALVAEVRREMAGWLDMAAQNIASFQRFFGQLALSNSYESIAFGLAEWGRVVNFAQLGPGALDPLVGLAGNGATLRSILDPTLADSLGGMTRYLLNSNGGPADILRAMQDGLGFGYNRALNTARTEPFRVYRELTRQQWAASGLVKRYKRVVTHDNRVCPGCLMAEGEIYSINDSLAEHSQGRCFMVPIFINQPTPKWVGGATWFRAQDEATQIDILGPGRYAAWREGKFALRDLVTRRRSEEWGDSVTPTPLKDLVATQ